MQAERSASSFKVDVQKPRVLPMTCEVDGQLSGNFGFVFYSSMLGG